MVKRFLAILMVAVLCVGCLPEENRAHTVSFDGHDGEYEFEDTLYKAGQKVVVYYTAIGTDTDYTFFMNGQKIDPEYEEKGYKIEFEMPANDVVITRESSNSLDPANSGGDAVNNGGEDFAMNPQMYVSFVIDGKWYSIEKAENATAGDFFGKVSSDHLPTLTMTDFMDIEKSADLPWELSTDLDEKMEAKAGDIVLFQGKTLALLYDDNTAEYTKIGSLSLTLDEMDELKKELKKKKDIKVDVVVEFTE